MSDSQETLSFKRDKSKRKEYRRKQKSTPIKKPDVVPEERRQLKRINPEEEEKINIKKGRESTLPEKNLRSKDDTLLADQPSSSDKKEIIEDEENKTDSKKKCEPSEAAETNQNIQTTNDPAEQKTEENLENVDNNDISEPQENNSNVEVLEISVIEMAQQEIQQLADSDVPDIGQQIQLHFDEIPLSQPGDGVYELLIEETKNNASSSTQETMITEPEMPKKLDDPKPDDAAPKDESPSEQSENKNVVSKTEEPCKGVDLPDQWFLDSGFPTERVAPWKNIFRTSKPVPFDTASTSRLPE